MYLKALELHGFKSFPDKTVLGFQKPVTAIVGPNGSGKSNIADALQWVMGEQSTRALRGGKMEDVIFGGTEARGQVGFAEVTLTLDNADGRLAEGLDEVQVTRRYYRSGESEYYINKKLVRLRDINELFMDTGLGREGYSIIGQGKIDAILSARSTDRREIFEEAAGISRFRHRKEEAERKLQHAEDDLLRIGDKISELELQVEPLRKQSETAKKYLILRDELRGLEISLWLTDLEVIADKAERTKKEQLASNADLERARASLEELYAAGEKFAGRMHEKDIEADNVRERASETEQRAAEEEAAAAVLNANLTHGREDAERIKSEISRREGQSAGIAGQIDEHRRRIGAIETENAAVEDDAKKLRARVEGLAGSESEAEARLGTLTKRATELSDRLSEKRAEHSSLTAAIQEMETRLTSGGTELSQERERLENARAAKAEDEKALQNAEEHAESLRNIVRGHELRLDGVRRAAENASRARTELEMEHNAAVSRRQLLRDMEREYEGYSRAVKTVMKEASRGALSGVRGPAGELIRSKEKYALAIETAMGAAMQNIIVESEGSGKSAINLLKRENAGRVTFLPMSVIRGTRLTERLDGEDGFEGVALDLVEFDQEYIDIYTSLLGRTAVVEELDDAIRIARKYNHKFRIVTLDGQVLNAGGSMTGGSASKGTGILSRRSELEALDKKEKKLARELDEAKLRQSETARSLSAAEYELRTAGDEVHAAQEEAVRLRTACEHHRVLVEALEGRVDELSEERERTEKRRSDAENDRAETEKAIAELERAIEDNSKELDSETADRQKLMELRTELFTEESALREKAASLEAERQTEERAVEELTRLKSELSGDREGDVAALRETEERCREIERQIEDKNRAAAALRDEAKGFRDRIAAIMAERMEIEAERTRSDRATQDKNKQLLDLEREAAKLEQRLQAAEMEEKQIIDKLWDSYELTRTTAMEQRLELESVPAARRRTGELRREMSSLGTPNLGAIEEFERVNTRYTYLTGQRDDIDKSKTELLELIGEITGNMETIFTEEFARIGESFKTVFLELFGGGRASIELEDPENPLESGIEIRVQPPGKAVKTITLLSGGEKAFVAIALYFAILRIRPTPFVVMDEIEAALDEANVIRVSEYLRKLADKTQFLIITHRRGTMEEADVLYGVTMQERGVSRVLTIDLEEAERSLDNA